MNLHPKQAEAVELCLDRSKRIVAITGPAGSGKTTTIRTVVDKLAYEGLVMSLCAPTGKAARRITQATGYEAVTIHKLLEYPRPSEHDPITGKPLDPGSPKRHQHNPLHADVVIADEYAMVNHELNRNLIDALKSGARLIVVGDVYQLPPIESYQLANQPLSPFELHLSRPSNCVALDHIFRQAEDGGILLAANQIKSGKLPPKSEDFQYAFTENHPAYIMKYIENAMDAGVDFSQLANQIITPEKHSWIGTNVLNTKLQMFYNQEGLIDSGTELPRYQWDKHPVTVARGDKVVCTENTYDMRNYYERYEQFNESGFGVASTFIETPPHQVMLNGEVGRVEDIFGDGSLYIDFGDRVVHVPSFYEEYNFYTNSFYPRDPRRAVDLAYALTTHKCQGSEFDRVLYCITGSRAYVLNRRNFYTAVTRAKHHVMTVCDNKALQYSLLRYVPPKKTGREEKKDEQHQHKRKSRS
jgi:exodeoxyribonuclease V alpha subunit